MDYSIILFSSAWSGKKHMPLIKIISFHLFEVCYMKPKCSAMEHCFVSYLWFLYVLWSKTSGWPSWKCTDCRFYCQRLQNVVDVCASQYCTPEHTKWWSKTLKYNLASPCSNLNMDSNVKCPTNTGPLTLLGRAEAKP